MEQEKTNSKCKNILVIEDNKELQNTLKMSLEIEGYTIFTADNGREGLDRLEKIPTPCLILLDLMMPIMNGWEFLEIINKDIMFSTIPVVVISAFDEKKGNITTNDFIQKPISLDTLLKNVRKHCT